MKMLLVLDALKFAKEQLEFPAFIASNEKDELNVLFFENVEKEYLPLSKYGHMGGYQLSNKENSEIKNEIIEKNLQALRQTLNEKGLRYMSQKVRETPEDKTITLSRFADLLLINASLTFDEGSLGIPAKFTEEVLTDAQCPVLIMPGKVEEINEIYFTYNGSFSSMYAIKQFTQLFPAFGNKKITVLYVSENDDEEVAHKQYIMDYLRHHYEHVEIKLLMGNPGAAILSHLQKQKNCLVTFGAYGRSKLSLFFKKSKAENILKKLDMPVFITHP